MSRRTLIVLGLIALISTWFIYNREPEQDYEVLFDRTVEEDWLVNFETEDAITFLERGGGYVNLGESDEQPIDRVRVVPLLQRMRDEYGVETLAIYSPKQADYALSLVSRLPTEMSVRSEIEALLREEQKTWPGDILQTWGKRWMSLDFLDPDEVEFLAGAELDE